MSQRIPIDRDDLLITVTPNSVKVSARTYSPYRWPAVRDVQLVFFGYTEQEAIDGYLEQVNCSGYYRDTLNPDSRREVLS